MKKLTEFERGDGSHWGLTDWYPENEAALKAALDAREPFDTGWYSSKKEIACARIWSQGYKDPLGARITACGDKIEVEVSITDDFDTPGAGSSSTTDWTLEAVASAIDEAWDAAQQNRKDNEPYTGFSIHDSTGAWIETYILSNGEFDTPPGDNYYWWGWQGDVNEDQGIPDPRIPAEAVQAFETYVNDWDRPAELTVAGWTIRPWK